MIPLLISALISLSPVDSLFSQMEANYRHIAAPDSTVPVPETRITDKGAPDTASYYQDSSYMVIRTDSTFDLFCLQTDYGLALNFHVHPMFHAHAHKAGDKWIWDTRPRQYTGYDAKAVLEDECKQDSTLPCHVFEGAWRLSPPRVIVRYAGPDSVVVSWGDSTRTWRKDK